MNTDILSGSLKQEEIFLHFSKLLDLNLQTFDFILVSFKLIWNKRGHNHVNFVCVAKLLHNLFVIIRKESPRGTYLGVIFHGKEIIMHSGHRKRPWVDYSTCVKSQLIIPVVPLAWNMENRHLNMPHSKVRCHDILQNMDKKSQQRNTSISSDQEASGGKICQGLSLAF